MSDDAGPPRSQLFRVHRFLLAHHSTTFANMFADATAALSELYDGVPIIKMQGDKAEDVAQLLNYLYNPTQMTFKRFDPNTPLVVSGVIRLAHKYCIESLREYLIKIVVSDWPTTLQEWDAFQVEINAIENRIEILNDPKNVEDMDDLCDHIPEPASAIVFALEFGCREILPAAFYQLMQISPRRPWEGYWRAVGKVARWSLLDKDTLLRYMMGLDTVLGYDLFLHQLLSEHCWPPTVPYGDYTSFCDSPCYLFSQNLIDRIWVPHGLKGDPLGMLMQCLEGGLSPSKRGISGQFCDQCCTSIRAQIASLRAAIWDELPNSFRLDEIDELQ